MGVLLGVAPWAIYWVLVGNVPLPVAAVTALAVAATVLVSSREPAVRVLGTGAIATFVVVGGLPLVFDAAPRWVLALSFAGLFAVLATSVAIGRPVAADFARADLPAAVIQTELFSPVVTRLNGIWLGALAAMTVSAMIPANRPAAPLTYLCGWVVPFGILAGAAVASRIVPQRMTAGFDDAVRKTSFVAFIDMEIDQLYYLATEHAKREVGPGQEAYNVTVGAKGTPLLGDDTRVSWPSTFKVRQRRP